MSEGLKVKLRSNIRLLIGVVGFGLIAYATAGLYTTHRQTQDAVAVQGVRYENIFTTAAEGYFAVFGIGSIIVLIASR